MHEDDLLAGLASLRDAPVPEAGHELRELFASVATIPAAEPARRLPVYKRILTGLPSKVAAGALGALLAGSVGAGALTGTMVLTTDDVVACPEDEIVEDEVVEGCEDTAADDLAGDGADVSTDEDDAEGDELSDAADTEQPKLEVAVDPATVPVPTVQSEAARNHAFDEACGNHGAYVSNFARTGEEPECATAARSGDAEVGATQADASEDGAVSDQPGDEGRAKAAAHREADTERRVARTAGASAKRTTSGKGGR